MAERDLLTLGQQLRREGTFRGEERLDPDVVPVGVNPLEVGERVDSDDLGHQPHTLRQRPQQRGAVFVEDAGRAVDDDDHGVVVAELALERVEALQIRIRVAEEGRVGEVGAYLAHTSGDARGQDEPQREADPGRSDDE